MKIITIVIVVLLMFSINCFAENRFKEVYKQYFGDSKNIGTNWVAIIEDTQTKEEYLLYSDRQLIYDGFGKVSDILISTSITKLE